MTEVEFRAKQRFEANDPAGASQMFTDAEYDALRDEALIVLSGVVPFDKTASLAVLSGVTAYALPADFIEAETLREGTDGLPVYRITTNTGAVLVHGRFTAGSVARYSASWGAIGDYRIAGTSLLLATAPTANATWSFTYGAKHVISTIPDSLWPLALLYATARIMERRTMQAAGGFKYNNGVEEVDKSSEGRNWAAVQKDRMSRFDEELEKLKRKRQALNILRTTGTDTWWDLGGTRW